ncbi:TPA: hypothetical protein ACX6RL_001522 [Photobacterium damselae]
MGKLGEQSPRKPYRVSDQHLDMYLTELKELAKKHNMNVRDVIQAKLVLEFERQNNITVDDGDYRDEHMDGIGNCLKEIAYAIQR